MIPGLHQTVLELTTVYGTVFWGLGIVSILRSDLVLEIPNIAVSECVVSWAVPVGNVSWMLFQEGRSSNFS
jgi:hypothetical protein